MELPDPTDANSRSRRILNRDRLVMNFNFMDRMFNLNPARNLMLPYFRDRPQSRRSGLVIRNVYLRDRPREQPIPVYREILIGTLRDADDENTAPLLNCSVCNKREAPYKLLGCALCSSNFCEKHAKFNVFVVDGEYNCIQHKPEFSEWNTRIINVSSLEETAAFFTAKCIWKHHFDNEEWVCLTWSRRTERIIKLMIEFYPELPQKIQESLVDGIIAIGIAFYFFEVNYVFDDQQILSLNTGFKFDDVIWTPSFTIRPRTLNVFRQRKLANERGY